MRSFPIVILLAAVAIGSAHAEGVGPLPQHLSLFSSPAPAPFRARPFPIPGKALSPGRQCREAIHAAETAAGIPEKLMAAIGRVESGRQEASGEINPWPWSINVEGTDHVFETKAEAIAAVAAYQRRGIRSIDVGCMQVNLYHHPDAFASLDEAFDPVANANYAARFLAQLHGRTGSWATATAWYHSATPELGDDYRRKVMAVWPMEKQRTQQEAAERALQTMRTQLAAAWAATETPHPAPAAPFGRFGAAPTPLPLARSDGNSAPFAVLARNRQGRSLADYRAMPIPLAAPRPASPSSGRD